MKMSNTTINPSTLYRYRNLPCSIADDDQLWAISGVDARGGSGVLEWCYDEGDARALFNQMKRYPQFTQLEVAPFLDANRRNEYRSDHAQKHATQQGKVL